MGHRFIWYFLDIFRCSFVESFFWKKSRNLCFPRHSPVFRPPNFFAGSQSKLENNEEKVLTRKVSWNIWDLLSPIFQPNSAKKNAKSREIRDNYFSIWNDQYRSLWYKNGVRILLAWQSLVSIAQWSSCLLFHDLKKFPNVHFFPDFLSL